MKFAMFLLCVLAGVLIGCAGCTETDWRKKSWSEKDRRAAGIRTAQDEEPGEAVIEETYGKKLPPPNLTERKTRAHYSTSDDAREAERTPMPEGCWEIDPRYKDTRAFDGSQVIWRDVGQ